MKFDLWIDVLHNKSACEIFKMFLTYSAHQTTFENLFKTRLILEMKFDLEIEIFKVKGVCGSFFTIFYVFSGSNYIRKPSNNLSYIRNKIWPLIVDFQGQGCLREFHHYFFHIQRVKLHRNTLSNHHDKWDKFFTLHFTMPAGLVDISTSIQVVDSTWDPVILCINFAFYKRSICTEIALS